MEQPAPVAVVVDLAAVARSQPGPIPLWTEQSQDLHVNLLSFEANRGVAEHVNAELDVLLVGVAGVGFVEVNGARNELAAGTAIVIPKGARRAITAGDGRFSYLSCHRRRAMLWPSARASAE